VTSANPEKQFRQFLVSDRPGHARPERLIAEWHVIDGHFDDAMRIRSRPGVNIALSATKLFLMSLNDL
jgi:hypothetical protein